MRRLTGTGWNRFFVGPLFTLNIRNRKPLTQAIRPNRTENGSQEPVLVRSGCSFFRFRGLDFETLPMTHLPNEILWMSEHFFVTTRILIEYLLRFFFSFPVSTFLRLSVMIVYHVPATSTSTFAFLSPLGASVLSFFLNS